MVKLHQRGKYKVGRKYAIIVGHGRSGSNWLLNLFDLSPATFCRDEPDLLESSPLAELRTDQAIRYKEQPLLHKNWDKAINFTLARMGAHDNPIIAPKQFMYELPRRFGAYRVVRGPRWRRLLARISPTFKEVEWRPPPYLINKRRFEETTAIVKLVTPPGWASFVLTHRPEVPVFHIVRHPGGFLNSWANRYLASHHEPDVLAANLARLHLIAELDNDWGQRFGAIDKMDVHEAELWYWLYVNEEISLAGERSPRFSQVVFEDLARDPIGTMGSLYDRLDIPFDEPVRRAIASMSAASGPISSKWRDRLLPEQQRLIERVLSESFLRSNWE